jgi:hypothetical protein
MKMSWMREWNLSYGRKLFEVDSTFALYAGVGIKYFQGLAYLDIRSENNQLDAFSAMSPVFGIDYGSAANLNPSNVAGNGMKPVGHGFGFDFGVNAGPGRAIKVMQSAVGVTPDGGFGPMTLAAVQAIDPVELIEKFSQAKEDFYRSLGTFATFGKGWLNRVADVKVKANSMLA